MTPNDPPHTSAARPHHSRTFRFAALGLVLVTGLTGLGLAYCFRNPAPPVAPPEPPPSEVKFPPHLFVGWKKPDFVILLSGEQHGYLQPCGCSTPQKGGLERRYNLIQLMEARGWPVVPVDLGDVPQIEGPAKLPNIQALIKYRYSMAAMKEMGYAGVGFGKHEAALSLDKVFSAWALNEPQPPLLAANFTDQGAFNVHSLVVKRVEKADVNLGVAGLIGPMIHEEIEKKDPEFKFATGADTLTRVLKEMHARKADLRLLLFQGSPVHGMKGQKPEVRALIDAFPQFDVLLSLSESDEPRSTAATIGKTMVVNLGHKARYVGVVGVWKTGNAAKPFELKYQFVELDETFKTPDEAAVDHKIIALMQKYKQELKDQNYLGKYSQHDHPHRFAVPKGDAPQYIGSESCKGCHDDAYDKWKHTPHSWAYKTLVDVAKNPSLNQYDPECIVCHTIGFTYKTGFRDEKTTPKLINVGCESCHGPGSEHRAAEQLLQAAMPSPLSQAWRDAMNPWRTPDNPENEKQLNKRILAADAMCRSCHDTDNDVTWKNKAYERKWLKIWHYEVRAGFNNRAQLIADFETKAREQKRKEDEEKKKGH
jgi:hypothetical protein